MAPYVSLPPVDRLLSPWTGWTRSHWEALADHLLESAAAYAAPDFAQLRLPGRASWSGVVCDGLEGFARTFLLAGFRIAGARGVGVDRHLERYARGLVAGADPAGPHAWPRITDCSQQMVEAASIAVALHETRPWLWDRLDPASQETVADWLGGFVGRRTWGNNWRLFQVVVEQFLASVGAPFEQKEIDAALDAIEEWYVGDGWYTDGPGQNFDYYAGWAMHLYPLLWSRMAGDDDGGRGEVYRGRLREFLGQYVHLFGSGGAPVHQGRSLCYRFGSVAPFFLGALCDATPLEPGQTRRLASGVVRHFVERGVPDERGLLTLGWYDQFLPATQAYSGPGSPYWASKGFAGLLLPPDHPVWTAGEQAVPIDRSDQVVAMPAPGWLVHSTRHDGIVRLLNHGSDHNQPDPAPAEDDPHYAKLAYSSRTAPESAESAWRRTVDGHAALLAVDGTPTRRVRIERIAVADRFAASRHRGTADGALDGKGEWCLETVSIVHGSWEVRAHLAIGAPGTRLRDGGYAVAGAAPLASCTGDTWATAANAVGLTSAVVGLHGWTEAALSREVQANAFGSHSLTPYLLSDTRQDDETVHVGLVVLSGDRVDPDALRGSVEVTVDGRTVEVRMPDGERIRVVLGDETAGATRYVRTPPDGIEVRWPA